MYCGHVKQTEDTEHTDASERVFLAARRIAELVART